MTTAIPASGSVIRLPRYRPLKAQKLAVVRALDVLGLNRLFETVLCRSQIPCIRAINMHETLPDDAPLLDEMLAYLASRYTPVGRRELDELLAGRWSSDKPGMMVTLDDGWKCQAEVAGPLLEKHGFSGWFFVPVGYLDEPEARFVKEHDRGEELLPMSWEDVRELDKRHVVACHSYTHVTLPAGTDRATLEREMVYSKNRLEEGLGHPVDAYCWVRGRDQDIGDEAIRLAREVGYRYTFLGTPGLIRPGSPMACLPRNQVEVRFPLHLARMQLSGIMDVRSRGTLQHIAERFARV